MTTTPLPYVCLPSGSPGFFPRSVNLGAEQPLLIRAENNKPPPGGPYLCFFTVYDYWRMITSEAEKHKLEHYSQVINADILSDLRTRRCALVFDLSNEGPCLIPEVFTELFDWIERLHIPAGQVVYLAQNRNIGSALRIFDRTRSDLSSIEYYDYFVKLMAHEFAEDSGRSPIGNEVDDFIHAMFSGQSKDKILLCLNATPRVPRVLTIGALLHHRLFDHSLVSFGGMDYIKGGDSAVDVEQFIDSHPELSYLKSSINFTLSMEPIKVDEFSETGNELISAISIAPYIRTYFSLVTETELRDLSTVRITEKTVKPFSLGHPTLIVGNPRSARFMADLGFELWPEVIRGDYDAETNPVRRFRLVVEETLRQARAILDQPQAWLDRVRDVGAANIRHAASGRLQARYVELYDRPIVARLAALAGAPDAGRAVLDRGMAISDKAI